MTRAVVWAVLLGAPVSLALGLATGSVDLPLASILAVLGGAPGDDAVREIVLGLRAPRALAAFACGALLAVAGALLQALLRNPLADPYLLGISGGASVGALGALLAGGSLVVQHGAALAGALLMALAVLAAALGPGGWNPHRVLLTGVALSSACGALVSLMLALAPAAQVPGLLFWLLGDLSDAGSPLLAWAVLALLLAMLSAQARSLDILALGEDAAKALGVNTPATRALAFIAAAVATMAAVLLGGAIGFVGLVVPHLLRLAGLYRHAALLPLSACLGGAMVTLADVFARSVAAPTELPAGAITALLGVPALIALLARSR